MQNSKFILMKKILIIRQKLLQKILPDWLWPKAVHIYGVEVKIRESGYTTGTKLALCRNIYEKEELFFVNKYIKKGDFVLEIGASLGIVTRLLSKKVGKTGKIIAIEASKKVFDKEYLKISSLPNVNFLNAIGFPCNNLDYTEYKNLLFEDAVSSLGGKINYNLNTEDENRIIDLRVIEEGYSRYCLVVDIEGAERELLKDSVFIDSRIKVLIIELHKGIYGTELEKEIQIKLETEGFQYLENSSDVYVYERR